MTRILVAAEIGAPPASVWEELRHVERHVNWMRDAVAINFTSDQREGIGTRFICRTKVGPLVTDDVMTITRWDEGVAMGVRHEGLVTGSGVFSLEPTSSGTRVTWREDLSFPWWGLGPLGGFLARPVLRWFWMKNLSMLATVVVARPSAT